jgi:hypothetical protein
MRAAAAAALIMAASCAPAAAATGPVAWNGATWCPSYHTWSGCNTVQNPAQFTSSFDPAQVTADTTGFTLAMNAAGTVSGAVNTQAHTTYPVGSSWSEKITLPCDSQGRVENWPAFWTDGTSGTWPGNGEIDILEGLGGHATWTVHYVNAAGQHAQSGGTPAGNWCGTHTYSAAWTTTAVTVTWDGAQVGQVTAAQMGVPMFSDNQNLINDYGAGTPGGPVTGGVSMIVAQP